MSSAEERRQVPPEIVSAAFLEFVEESGSSVRLSLGIIDFVRVVEEGAKASERVSGKGPFESTEVVTDRIVREVIDDVALASGRRAFHDLAVPAQKDAVQRPGPFGCGPVEGAVCRDLRGEVDDGACLRVGDQREDRKRLGKADLLESQRLQIGIRLERLHEVADLQFSRRRLR